MHTGICFLPPENPKSDPTPLGIKDGPLGIQNREQVLWAGSEGLWPLFPGTVCALDWAFIWLSIPSSQERLAFNRFMK